MSRGWDVRVEMLSRISAEIIAETVRREWPHVQVDVVPVELDEEERTDAHDDTKPDIS